VNETHKSALRRSHEPAFLQHYFAGDGLEISRHGASSAALKTLFPRIGHLTLWDGTADEAAQLRNVPDVSFDFIHAGSILAETSNPAKALARWLDVLRPGGYAIFLLPDEDLHGKGRWPNPFNPKHKSSFTIYNDKRALPQSINVLDLVRRVAPIAACERVVLVRDHHIDNQEQRDLDQSAHGMAECMIEVVLRKREVESAQQMLTRLAQAGNAEQSVTAGWRAVRAYPYRHEVYHHLMMEWSQWNRVDEIDAALAQMAGYMPDEHLPRLYRSLHTISRGHLSEGFRMREEMMDKATDWRGRTTVPPPDASKKWTGQPLAGKSIVVWSEFGLGDEIFFLRCARMLRERCGASRVTVMCQSPLVKLFEASGEADAVIDVRDAAQLPQHDYWVYPHAIPAWLPLQLDALPASVPYLRTPVAKLTAPAGALKVGIAFKGSPTHENDASRSLPSLDVLDALFTLRGVAFYSLQKGAGTDEAAAYAQRLPNFCDLGPHLHSMEATASAIAALDLVICVDTSVAHVAGALGKPTWLMLPSYADWRWHYVREDSPWYPTMRLFRTPQHAGWSHVVARMRDELDALTQRRHAIPQATNQDDLLPVA
jgi:SAM-dependent methyltransferase